MVIRRGFPQTDLFGDFSNLLILSAQDYVLAVLITLLCYDLMPWFITRQPMMKAHDTDTSLYYYVYKLRE